MKTGRTSPISRFIHSYAATGSEDDELLRRFALWRDEAAFEVLVRRHGPMIWGVCRRILGDVPDAEDAFQATLLVLARKAGSVGQPALLANWLHGVARRTALKARTIAFRRRVREQPLVDVPVESPVPDVVWTDLRRVLDEEIGRLPEKFRVPFVLCYLSGKSNAEAARLVGCPIGTILSRLSSARARLRSRLSRRGLAVPAAALASIISVNESSAALPTALAHPTSRAALLASPLGPVNALAKGVIQAMSARTRFSFMVVAAVTATVLAGGVAIRAVPGPPPIGPPNAPATGAAPVDKPRAPVLGRSFAVASVTTDLQRRLIYRADANSAAMVLIDVAGVFADRTKLDPTPLELSDLGKALKEFWPGNTKTVHFATYIGPTPPNPDQASADFLHLGLEGLGLKAGFGRAIARMTFLSQRYDWDALVAPLRDPLIGLNADEAADGDATVHCYPVKTPLSRILMPGADCFIDVLKKLDPSDVTLPAGVEKAAKAAVTRLKLPPGAKVVISFPHDPPGTEREIDRVRAIANHLASEVGLELRSFDY